METERYVLFSPVGMTDPISDCRDGSMLHIARRFRPERVYIYLSQETAAFEEADGRYAGALSLLAEKLSFHVEVTKISRPDLVDVHLFDEFYDEFEGIIKSIKDENPEAVILLNVSSGTPAMKSALHTIAAMTDDAECIPIQVSTPRKAHNERRYDVKKYDLATEWELDEDNDTERFTDRCSCSDHYNLLLKIKKEIIRNHIDAYDYRAALALAKDCGRGVGERAKAYLRAACARVQLDEQGVDAQLAETRAGSGVLIRFAPVRGERRRSIVEYLLWLEMKLRRAEHCDFIRGISPIFLDLLEEAADTACGVKINDFCRIMADGKRIMSIDVMSKSVKGREVLNVLNEAFRTYGGYRNSDLSPAQLVPVIEALSQNEELKACVRALRGAEQNCRNMAAHEIVSVTGGWIKERCGLTPDDILKMLNNLAEYAGLKQSEIKNGSYDKMNELIKESL